MPTRQAPLTPMPRASGHTTTVSRDRGITLVEVLITVAVMGVVLVPVMYALMSSIKASAMSMESAEVQTVLQNAADRVNRAPRGVCYQPYVEAAAVSEWGSAAAGTVTVQEHRYVPDVDDGVVEWVPATCSSPEPVAGTVQSVLITVTSPYMNVSRSVEVIKSDL